MTYGNCTIDGDWWIESDGRRVGYMIRNRFGLWCVHIILNENGLPFHLTVRDLLNIAQCAEAWLTP